MRHRSTQGLPGFTLIELLIGVVLFLLILLGIYEMFDSGHLTFVKGERKLDVQQSARLAMDTMARELRMAGYFPENFDTNTASNLAPAATAIHVAAAGSLAISGDLTGGCNPAGIPACPDYSSKVYLYCLSGTTLLRKATDFTTPTSGVPPAAAYTCGGDVLAENVAVLTFSYYDANNGLLSALPLNAADRDNVRTVVITLVATEAVPGPGQAPQTFTLTQSVRLRNRNTY
jgi:prepilin-type N-terminal cleavage/methylation domain-containing protein